MTDIGFFWVSALTKDGTILVANNYALGYIPDGVHLPDQVTLATADETIPARTRGAWATYPMLALHGWAQHHDTELRVVIATEEQFKGFDPGAPKIVLQPDDIPTNGTMEGRHRLQVIAPGAARQLAAVTGSGLAELLPPAPADSTPPQDRRQQLWFEVFRPLLSTAPDRAIAQLRAFAAYAEHAQELALHRAHTATETADQRGAIADWIYWQHLNVLKHRRTAGRGHGIARHTTLMSSTSNTVNQCTRATRCLANSYRLRDEGAAHHLTVVNRDDRGGGPASSPRLPCCI